MNGQNRSHDTPEKYESRINELTVSLHDAQRKLVDLEALVATANQQTETARMQYAQTAERMEALRHRLDANAAELKASRESIEARDRRIFSLEHEVQLRNERIATLEAMSAANGNTSTAVVLDSTNNRFAHPREHLEKIGFVLESLDLHGLQHKIKRVTTTIGRSSVNDFTINAHSVSRYHARIVVESEGVYLNDMYSKNGCTVNGRLVTRQILTDGDAISIGDCKFRFSVVGPSTKSEDRSMDETFPLLEDEMVFTTVLRSKSQSLRPVK